MSFSCYTCEYHSLLRCVKKPGFSIEDPSKVPKWCPLKNERENNNAKFNPESRWMVKRQPR